VDGTGQDVAREGAVESGSAQKEGAIRIFANSAARVMALREINEGKENLAAMRRPKTGESQHHNGLYGFAHERQRNGRSVGDAFSGDVRL